MSMLPTQPELRKALPIFTGVVLYFPNALLAVAEVSRLGNDQHNPGESLHWNRKKSPDHLDCALRHMIDHGQGTIKDTDGAYHLAKAIWRLCAELQLMIENLEGPNVDDRPKVCVAGKLLDSLIKKSKLVKKKDGVDGVYGPYREALMVSKKSQALVECFYCLNKATIFSGHGHSQTRKFFTLGYCAYCVEHQNIKRVLHKTKVPSCFLGEGCVGKMRVKYV